MSIQLIGSGGVQADVDANKALLVRPHGARDFGAAGGGFSVSGYQTAVVAAALAANTMLASFRFNPASTRKMYITRIRLLYNVVTAFAAAAVPGALVLQKFTAQTPTGGTQRTPARKNQNTGSGTDLLDARDSNAALTGSAPTFGDIVAAALAPAFTVSGSFMEWILDQDDFNGEPLVLIAGDGLALRTGTGAFGATGTWLYSYIIHYLER